MTGGAGFSSSATSRSTANRNALNSQKTPWKEAPVGAKENDIKLSFIKPSKEELENVKSQINNDIKKREKRS